MIAAKQKFLQWEQLSAMTKVGMSAFVLAKKLGLSEHHSDKPLHSNIEFYIALLYRTQNTHVHCAVRYLKASILHHFSLHI